MNDTKLERWCYEKGNDIFSPTNIIRIPSTSHSGRGRGEKMSGRRHLTEDEGSSKPLSAGTNEASQRDRQATFIAVIVLHIQFGRFVCL